MRARRPAVRSRRPRLTFPCDLDTVWFALETDVVPPSWVYVELADRSNNTKYKSNLADTA